jgi:hypothetical protein
MNNINNEALSDMIQRFAISALSRERKGEALNEEIIAGKFTGEFYIKSKDGVVLSADILNREKSATDTAIRIAELVGMTGRLFKVDFEYITLPNHVNYSTNILVQVIKDENGNDVEYYEPISIPDGCKDILINLDLDEYDILGDSFKPVHSEGKVKIVISNNDQEIVVEKDLRNINYSLISLKDFSVNNNLKITEITIEQDENVFNVSSIGRTILLHNIFITVNE